MNQFFENQLTDVITEYDEVISRSKHSDGSDILKKGQYAEFHLRVLAAIERVVGRSSVYFEKANRAIGDYSSGAFNLSIAIGIAKALRSDLRNGYLVTLSELVHAEVFADYLEMAGHLLDSHFKDAAAVLAGSSLEAHLKQLARKHSLDLLKPTGEPKKASSLNDELKAATAYGPLDHKSITSWLGLRNDAAHGEYSNYTEDQVKLLVAGIRDFITRKPA